VGTDLNSKQKELITSNRELLKTPFRTNLTLKKQELTNIFLAKRLRFLEIPKYISFQIYLNSNLLNCGEFLKTFYILSKNLLFILNLVKFLSDGFSEIS
jgi:hypothetical protein